MHSCGTRSRRGVEFSGRFGTIVQIFCRAAFADSHQPFDASCSAQVVEQAGCAQQHDTHGQFPQQDKPARREDIKGG
ncbi:MAG: hypothetical protein WAL71_10010 [Terriglobales bacterium]